MTPAGGVGGCVWPQAGTVAAGLRQGASPLHSTRHTTQGATGGAARHRHTGIFQRSRQPHIMTRAIGEPGGGLRGCVLLCCVAAVLSRTTVTQQSSSAWGSNVGGRPVDQGTHTSHTTDVLPEDDVSPGDEDLDLDLGFRFGGGHRRTQPQPHPQPQPQQPQSPQPQPQLPQQPQPGLGVGAQGGFGADSGQPFPGHAASEGTPDSGSIFPDSYYRLLAKYPNFNMFIPGQNPQYPGQYPGQQPQYPWQQPGYQPGFHPGYQPQPGYHPGYQHPQWAEYQPQQPALDTRGSFDQQTPSESGSELSPAGESGEHDPSRQPAPPGGPGAGTSPRHSSSGAVPTGVHNWDNRAPSFGFNPSQSAGSPGLGGSGGAGGAGGFVYPSFGQQNYPLFPVPDISGYANQLTQRALENIARGMTFNTGLGGVSSPVLSPGGVPVPSSASGTPGAPGVSGGTFSAPGAPGSVSGVQFRHGFSSSPPGQPPSQSQHSSVNSFSVQRSQPGQPPVAGGVAGQQQVFPQPYRRPPTAFNYPNYIFNHDGQVMYPQRPAFRQ